MVIVTGGAGFIGSNILKKLNGLGKDDIVVVDNLTKSDKYRNLVGVKFFDYLDKNDFLHRLEAQQFGNVQTIFHQGACTDTMEYDGEYMMRNNYEFSKRILDIALSQRINLISASSAAVYGNKTTGRPDDESPLNVYGFSKLAFDRYAMRRAVGAEAAVVGLRYFNVYGPGESHKGRMASMVYNLTNQIRETGKARLFGAFGGYGPGEQKRDFVNVDDIAEINLHFAFKDPVQTVVDAGTGSRRTWNELAAAVMKAHGAGEIEYIDFPLSLADKYQFDTCADTTELRKHGFTRDFKSLEDGVAEYVGAVT